MDKFRHMKPTSESTTRNPLDFAHFAVAWFGFVIGAAGIATLSIATMVFGGLLMTLGLAYFVAHASAED
jgi:hypothetical protein